MKFVDNEMRSACALGVRYLRGLVTRGWKSLIGFLRSISQVPKRGENETVHDSNA